MMTVITRLSEIINEMSIVARLGPNERPHQSADGIITSVYTNPYPNSNEGISVFWTVPMLALQAAQRKTSGQSTRATLQRIQSLVEEILHYTIAAPTPFEYFNFTAYSSRIEKFTQLQIFILQTLNSGLPNFQKTSISCSSSLYSQSGQEKEDRKALFDSTIQKVESAIHRLTEKINEYNHQSKCELNLSIEELQLEEHLLKIIQIILNPNPSLDSSKLMTHGYKDFPADIAIKLLLNSFEEQLIFDVLSLYQLKHISRLTYADLQAILVGICANLTFLDLEKILEKTEGVAFKKLHPYLGDNIPKKLDEQLTIRILDSLRTLDVGGIHCPQNRQYCEQLYGDLLFLESCKKVIYYNKNPIKYSNSGMDKLRKFGRIEQFAREYVFALFRTERHQFRDKILFPSYDENGSVVCFEGCRLYNDSNTYALISFPQPNLYKCCNLVNISFRGAYQQEILNSNSYGYSPESSWIAFEKENNTLVTNFLNILVHRELAADLKIEINGQGLGGSTAQRFTEALSNHFSKSIHKTNSIKEISLYCFDSPPIEEHFINRFISNAFHISELTFTFRYFTSHSKLSYYEGIHYLGFSEYNKPFPKNLEITWINFLFRDKNGNHIERLSDTNIAHFSTVERFYESPKTWGNNDAFFIECNRYTMEKNPVFLNYYCTTMTNEPIPEKCQNKNIKAMAMPQVLTVGFTL